MKLLSPAISRLALLRIAHIERWVANPVATQREVLQDLVTHGQYTSFGRKYGFNEIFNIRKFKEAVPISEYEDLKPFIDRLFEGEEQVLWNTPVQWFAKSSGTTSDKSKFIPITEESLEDCHYQAAKDVLALYYKFNNDSDLLTGKGLVIGGSHQISKINDEISVGDLSAVLLQNTPSTILENVTSISGVPTWTLLLIKRILEITGKQTLKEVWPSLELYIHGGVSFTPYKEQFQKLIGPGCTYLEMYNASEGFFAAQDDPSVEGMLLFLDHGIFYEFMPTEEYGKEKPRTIGLDKVELDKNYALVISTNGGLWRYLVGDTVKFTSLTPYRIVVTGRLKQFINAFGEEVMVDNTDKAIAAAAASTGLVVKDYTAAPIYFGDQNQGAHEWLIEFENTPENLAAFTLALDQHLKSLNSDYEAKRYKDIALGLPKVTALPEGLFHTWLKNKGKLGGQHKVPRLSNDRKYIDELLLLLQQYA